MTRVLVLGATGMLGHAVVAELDSRFEVHKTLRDAAERRGSGDVGGPAQLRRAGRRRRP